MLRVLRVLRSASICPGLNFSDSGGQSKSVLLCRHRVVSRLPDTCISKLLTRRSTEVCRSAASVLIVTSACCSFLLQFITLRHRTSKYYGSHNQCSGFFVGQPFDISQISMPCSARSSSVQTPRAASLMPNHDLSLQGSADRQPVCYHEAFFLGLCNGGQCIFSTLAHASTVGSSRPSISNSSFIGTWPVLPASRSLLLPEQSRSLRDVEIFGEGVDRCVRFRLMLSCRSSTVITLSSQPLSCEARPRSDRYGQSPAPGYRLQRRYHGVFIFIHHDRSNVCRCHCVITNCAGLSSHRTISIRSPPIQ